MNRYPLTARPKRWDAKLSPFWVRLLRGWQVRHRQRTQQLHAVDVHGVEHVDAALKSGRGVLITPNHPGHADAYIMYEAAHRIGQAFYFMSAWQVFEMQGPIGRWLLQKHGCFSVDREGADRHAFKRAVEILAAEDHPLVVFAEGEVYHQNDRVTPFRDGAAAIALSASKKAEREIVAIPSGIKYTYLEDPMPALLDLMDRLEQEILWRPRRDEPLSHRIYGFAHGLLTLKEIEYLGEPGQGPLPDRIRHLADSILGELEARYEISNVKGGVPERVKEVRRAILVRLESLDTAPAAVVDPTAQDEREAIARDLDDVFLVVQAFSYPGDYVDENPSVERLAETLDKFEEDVLGAHSASIRAPRRATISFGEPIAVDGSVRSRSAVADLTVQLEQGVQRLLNELNATNHEEAARAE